MSRNTLDRKAQMTYSTGSINPTGDEVTRGRVNRERARATDRAILSYTGRNYGPAVEAALDAA